MTRFPFIALPAYREYPADEMVRRAHELRTDLGRRRSVRDFSDRPVPREVIEEALRTAGGAPSGANLQPWHFVVVTDPALKREIRVAAEAEERAFYRERAPRAWLDALAPLGTDEDKPFLETAPYLIAIFVRPLGQAADGSVVKHYYATESVGIATGFLLVALHHAGLCTLTHTPSPMAFLGDLLERPKPERPFLLVVTGYPAPGARVPDLTRKPLTDFATFR